MNDIWQGIGIWEGWRLTLDHAASSHNQPVLVSPTGKAYAPGDIELPPPEKVGHNELAELIGTSKQALRDRRVRGTVPPPDGETEAGRPFWHYDTIKHLIKA